MRHFSSIDGLFSLPVNPLNIHVFCESLWVCHWMERPHCMVGDFSHISLFFFFFCSEYATCRRTVSPIALRSGSLTHQLIQWAHMSHPLSGTSIRPPHCQGAGLPAPADLLKSRLNCESVWLWTCYWVRPTTCPVAIQMSQTHIFWLHSVSWLSELNSTVSQTIQVNVAVQNILCDYFAVKWLCQMFLYDFFLLWKPRGFSVWMVVCPQILK